MGLFSFIGDAVEDLGDSLTGAWKDISGRSARDAEKDAAKAQLSAQDQAYSLFEPYANTTEDIALSNRDATAVGFGQNIGDIFSSGALDPLISERQDAATNYMASRGLRRSGAAASKAAEIPTDLAFALEQELSNRRASNIGRGYSATSNMANIRTGQGLTSAEGILGAQSARAAGNANLVDMGTDILGALLSDERLKSNIEQIGSISGVPVISWSWNNDAYEKYGLSGSSLGFSAQEIKKIKPHCVDDSGEHLRVYYDKLLEELNHGG